ncbi:uncharacterized protein MICPUCDRAFT_54877 [Micromonas pusilla CCMP1545]|uniref:Predicted protein n=1 Tax=Micromonas pusilla (strain CCMP1545) TaxID=564608 RepID=C1NAF2_MICPC|nr:uncharacterized protein MICPUCDRAFT_54877 [Micromonas pusilla CCMP1545]EEH50875.1 predicted protein [Micromonas pusilla CCMP1545]|eukprot:XP_003064895.1 predicted protein [Micromonas pusilla CCMP1545]
MYGIKPDMTKVKVFGCEVYELISKQRNTGLGQKLNPRAKAFMYVGHSETTIADSYKLYDRVSKTVKTGSISKCIENVDEYGKVPSKHNHSYAHDFSVRETLPEDFCEGKEAEKFLVKVIQDFDLYHDSKNATTHLLIKVKPSTGRTRWMFATSMFKRTTSEKNLKVIFSKLQNFLNKKDSQNP